MTRVLALLGLALVVSLGLSFYLGEEILAALGMIVAQSKALVTRLFGLKWAALVTWLKAQGINFARVEIAKRWFMKSLLPLIIGATMRRRIAGWYDMAKAAVLERHARLRAGFAQLHPVARIVVLITGIALLLSLTATTLGLWVLVFSIQVPIWIVSAFSALWIALAKTVQKLVFRTIAFMQLFVIWRGVKGAIPRDWRQRLRRLNYRLARRVVRRRRLTTEQLHKQKDGLRLKFAVMREFLSARRVLPPTSPPQGPPPQVPPPSADAAPAPPADTQNAAPRADAERQTEDSLR